MLSIKFLHGLVFLGLNVLSNQPNDSLPNGVGIDPLEKGGLNAQSHDAAAHQETVDVPLLTLLANDGSSDQPVVAKSVDYMQIVDTIFFRLHKANDVLNLIALNRVVQLFNKTNQFNLTTKRYQVEDVIRFMESEEYRIYDLHVVDRFGDHGLVGTAVIRKQREEWHIDSLLMSCRVMGLGIETAFLERIYSDAVRERVVRLIGEYVQTKKNQPVKEFYAEHGFSLLKDEDGRQEWKLNVAATPINKPSWITIGTRERAF